jgi:NAD(P)-dependent dehydrogenase (short-subunit alcohol dehydrogenase family)
MNANVNGAFYCIHAVLPHMREHGTLLCCEIFFRFFSYSIAGGGLIVNVSSIASLRGLPLAGTAYCASKAAMSMMGATVSAEQFQHNIRVCNFCPGMGLRSLYFFYAWFSFLFILFRPVLFVRSF